MSKLFSFALFLASVLIYARKAGRNTWWFIATLTAPGLFTALNITLLANDYSTGDSINDVAPYTLISSLTGAGVGKYIPLGIGIVLGLITTFGALGWILRHCRHHPYHFGCSLLALLLALGSVDVSPAFCQITELVKSQLRDDDPDFMVYYKEPLKTISDPKLNLVHTCGESLERTYFDNGAFPDLMPELGALENGSLGLSHTQRLPEADCTIAGMMASRCGIPLFTPFEGNASASVSSLSPQNTCLGDILKDPGYQNYFMQGVNSRFADKNVFLKSHGLDRLYGSEELESVVADSHYRNNWGFYDGTVLDGAQKKFEEFPHSGQRFSLSVLTVDTHRLDGFISCIRSHKKYDFVGKPNQSLSVVDCNQENIAAFINKIKVSPWFKDTVIVVSFDHLTMNNTAWKYLNRQDRNNLFFIIRGNKPQQEALVAKRSTMDNGTTVLGTLGDDNYLGLGHSGLSRQSMSEIFPNIEEKTLAWKPDIIHLWKFPKEMKEPTIDQQENMTIFSDSHSYLLLLLRVSDKRMKPLLENEYLAPLRLQPVGFALRDNFVWVNRCYKMT